MDESRVWIMGGGSIRDEEIELGCKVGIYASFIFFLNIDNYFKKNCGVPVLSSSWYLPM